MLEFPPFLKDDVFVRLFGLQPQGRHAQEHTTVEVWNYPSYGSSHGPVPRPTRTPGTAESAPVLLLADKTGGDSRSFSACPAMPRGTPSFPVPGDGAGRHAGRTAAPAQGGRDGPAADGQCPLASPASRPHIRASASCDPSPPEARTFAYVRTSFRARGTLVVPTARGEEPISRLGFSDPGGLGNSRMPLPRPVRRGGPHNYPPHVLFRLRQTAHPAPFRRARPSQRVVSRSALQSGSSPRLIDRPCLAVTDRSIRRGASRWHEKPGRSRCRSVRPPPPPLPPMWCWFRERHTR